MHRIAAGRPAERPLDKCAELQLEGMRSHDFGGRQEMHFRRGAIRGHQAATPKVFRRIDL